MFRPTSTTSAQAPASQALRIRRLSRLLAAACLALIVGLALAVPIAWALADVSVLASQAHLNPADIQAAPQLWQRLLGAAITSVPVALLSMGLWQARRCFLGFKRGQVFTAQAVQCLRRFAAWVMGSAVAAIVAAPLLSVVLTLGNAPGERQLVVGVGSDFPLTLLFAAIVWLMAAVIDQGMALADENAAFV